MPNYLNSPLGVLTYYNDNNLYNYFYGKYSNHTYLLDNGELTAAGSEFIANFPTNSLYLSIQKRDGEVTADFKNMLNSIFPNTIYKDNEPGKTYEFYNNEGRYVKTETDVRQTPLNNGAIDIYGFMPSSYRGFFYGGIINYDSSNPGLNSAMFSIIIFNDDYSKYLILGFGAFYTSSGKSTWVRMARLANSGYSSEFIEFFKNANSDTRPPKECTDPYGKGGDSETGGGTGDFDGTGNDIDIPDLPTLSSVDTGFITLFNPSASELRNLANYMWGDLFDVSTWKKIFADPMDAILGLSIVPVAVPNGGSSDITVGNISTGVSMNKAASQYVAVDCGTLNVNEYWGGYLDYDPYTKAEIYLPYIGIHPLAVDDIMNKPVHVVYHIDILSGACCAYVKCGGSVLYSFVGQCSCSIPITGNDWTNVVNGALSIAASIGTMVATGGASAPMSVTSIASTSVNSMKPNVEKSGSLGGMGGMLGVQTPYLILTRPRQALPARQNEFMGYPSFITMSLGDCSGYTEIEKIHLENIPATEQELSEIENLLKGGVIL